MQLLRSGTRNGLLKYFIFGLVGLSVGGLALMDVRGVLGGSKGVSGSDVIRAGDETLDIYSFDRTVRRSLAQYRISPEQAYTLGLIDEILSNQVRLYMLSQEAHNKGLGLDKERLALRVAEVVQPNAQSGQSMQDALEVLLQRQGMSEDEFVQIMKREVTSGFLMQAMRAGFSPDNDILAEEFLKFQNQTRDIDAIFFADKDVKGIKPATDAQLERLYESVKQVHYKIPEYRIIKMAAFNSDKLDIKVEVTTAEVRQAYEDHKDHFMIGEQVVLTQALVDTSELAQSIYDEVQNGKNLKEAVIVVTGSDEVYYESRNFEVSSMLPVMLEVIAGLKENDIEVPVQTMLGHHVIRLDKRIESQHRPFEEVKEEINKELLLEKRNEEIYEISQDLDESLDSGVSFENLVKVEDYPLEISSFGPFDETGLNKDKKDGLAAIDDEDREDVRTLSFELVEGEASLLQELPSGALVAFTLKTVEPENFKSFADVKNELAEQYISDQKHAQNREQIAKYLAEIGTGGSTFEGLSREHKKDVKSFESVGISGDMPVPLMLDMRATIFQTPIGDYEMLELEDQFALIKISGFDIPDITKDENVQETLQNIAQTIDKELEDDAFLMYLRELADREQPKVNKKLLEQTYNKGQ